MRDCTAVDDVDNNNKGTNQGNKGLIGNVNRNTNGNWKYGGGNIKDGVNLMANLWGMK